MPTFEILVTIFPNLNYTIENANNNINEWQKLVDAHRLKGWTPRNINKEDNKISDKNNNSSSGKNQINKKNKSYINNNNNNSNSKFNKEKDNILRTNVNKWKPEKINIK